MVVDWKKFIGGTFSLALAFYYILEDALVEDDVDEAKLIGWGKGGLLAVADLVFYFLFYCLD